MRSHSNKHFPFSTLCLRSLRLPVRVVSGAENDETRVRNFGNGVPTKVNYNNKLPSKTAAHDHDPKVGLFDLPIISCMDRKNWKTNPNSILKCPLRTCKVNIQEAIGGDVSLCRAVFNVPNLIKCAPFSIISALHGIMLNSLKSRVAPQM